MEINLAQGAEEIGPAIMRPNLIAQNIAQNPHKPTELFRSDRPGDTGGHAKRAA